MSVEIVPANSETSEKCVSCISIVFHHHSDLIWRRTQRDYDRVREQQLLQVLDCMKKHPDFRFTVAQSYIPKTFFQEHPEREGEFRSLIAAGKIELVGGGVTIPDTNLPNGEAILRNFFMGKQYYKSEFGVDVQTAWLMDAFGMSGQLPQILKGLGFQFVYPGRMPGLSAKEVGNVFRWHGIDNSTIVVIRENALVEAESHLCNLPITYSPEERLKISLEAMSQLEGNVFGMYSTEEDLFKEEAFFVLPELSKETGRPYRFSTVQEITKTIDTDKIPEVSGEFNPEFTGCYTTRIQLKQLNRQAEAALLAAEVGGVLASLGKNAPYPQARLQVLWEKLFMCQFHDGICGCHISAVCDEMHEAYHAVIAAGQAMSEHAVGLLANDNLAQSGDSCLTLFNPLLDERDEVVFLEGVPAGTVLDADGNELPTQQDGERLAVSIKMLGMSLKSLVISEKPAPQATVQQAPEKLSFATPHYKVSYADGSFSIKPRFLETALLCPENFGEILFREDRGDLWTEELQGLTRGRENSCEYVERVETGPLFTRILIHGEVKSRPRSFESDDCWEGFETLTWDKEWLFFSTTKEFRLKLTLQWHGNNTHIAIAFPLLIDPTAAVGTYEIPFGCISRQPYFEVPYETSQTATIFEPTVFDKAKGDWPALGWVDYADAQAGLTVANTGTPGHQLKAGTIYTSLLRSPTQMGSHFVPDAGAWENGKRVYEFSFLPHQEGLSSASAQLGRATNNPLIAYRAAANSETRPQDRSFIQIDNPQIALSALKQAESGEGIILRMYESMGETCNTTIDFSIPIEEMWLTDLNEDKLKQVQGHELSFRPFEIKTLLLKTNA